MKRVEYANLLPSVLRFLDELQVPLRLGVLIVGRFVLKHHVQGHVEVAIIHRPFYFFGDRSHGKSDVAGVTREVLLAGGDERLPGLRANCP